MSKIAKHNGAIHPRGQVRAGETLAEQTRDCLSRPDLGSATECASQANFYTRLLRLNVLPDRKLTRRAANDWKIPVFTFVFTRCNWGTTNIAWTRSNLELAASTFEGRPDGQGWLALPPIQHDIRTKRPELIVCVHTGHHRQTQIDEGAETLQSMSQAIAKQQFFGATCAIRTGSASQRPTQYGSLRPAPKCCDHPRRSGKPRLD